MKKKMMKKYLGLQVNPVIFSAQMKPKPQRTRNCPSPEIKKV